MRHMSLTQVFVASYSFATLTLIKIRNIYLNFVYIYRFTFFMSVDVCGHIGAMTYTCCEALRESVLSF